MGQAERKPDPANKQKDVIQRFDSAYSAALIDAQVSAEHTATEGWQKLYHDHVESLVDRRRALAKSMRETADIVELRGTNEEDEKEIGELKKTAVSIRDSDEAFDRQVIQPVRRPVETCERIINEHISQAGREERDAPLHNTGLEHLMRAEVAKRLRVSWDTDTGRVLVEAPASA